MSNSARTLTHTTALAALLALCACTGSSSNNTAPRLTTIPQQLAASGSTVTVDVSTYVTNQESDVLTYEVVSGGGAFTGSTYSNTFDTLGSYSVDIKVTDALGKSNTGTITVKVTSASLMVYDETENGVPSLYLLDTATLHKIRFAAGGDSVTFKTALPKGHVVYEKSIGGLFDLYVWDPYTKTTTALGTDQSKNERYVGKTSDGKVVFTVATGSDTDLYLWNPATGMTRTISNTDGQVDDNAVVTSGDHIFYEKGSAGQRDVWYYSYDDDISTVVSNAATAESIVRTLDGEAVLLTRVGAGGETDLFYFKISSGLVEIAGDVSSGYADFTKTYRGVDASGRIWFEASRAGANNLVGWDPSNGDLRTVASVTASGSLVFGFAAGGHVTYSIDPAGTTYDVKRYTWATGATATVANSSDKETPAFMLTTGQIYYLRYASASDVDLYYWNGTSASAVATAGTGAYSIVQSFEDGKIVIGYDYVPGTGSPLAFFDTAASSVITGVNSIVATTGLASGDFVMQEGTGTSADLKYFTASGTALSTISATASVGDIYVGKTSACDVLLRRSTGTTNNLWFWKQSTNTLTQVTDNSATHTTGNAFSAAL